MNTTQTTMQLVQHAATPIAGIRQRYTVGTQFRIDAPGYPKKIYTVTAVKPTWVVADCGDGIITTLDFDVIEYYSNLRKIRIVGCCEHLTDAQYSDYANHVAESEERVRG